MRWKALPLLLDENNATFASVETDENDLTRNPIFRIKKLYGYPREIGIRVWV